VSLWVCGLVLGGVVCRCLCVCDYMRASDDGDGLDIASLSGGSVSATEGSTLISVVLQLRAFSFRSKCYMCFCVYLAMVVGRIPKSPQTCQNQHRLCQHEQKAK